MPWRSRELTREPTLSALERCTLYIVDFGYHSSGSKYRQSFALSQYLQIFRRASSSSIAPEPGLRPPLPAARWFGYTRNILGIAA